MAESVNADIEQRLARLEQQDYQIGSLVALLGRQEPARAARHWDAYTAGIATLIGLVALIVSSYTAYVQRQQLRAQVWPCVAIATGNVAPMIGWQASNSGTGPARVTAVRVTVDKKPVSSWASAQKAMEASPVGLVISQLSNTVLPAGAKLAAVSPLDAETTPQFMQQFLSGKHAIVVTVCYCSVLDECWVVTSDTVPEAIADADACPIPRAERFTQ